MDARHPNLADPECEPTDDELIGLSKRAFEGLKDAEAVRRERIRADIAVARQEALSRLARRPAR